MVLTRRKRCVRSPTKKSKKTKKAIKTQPNLSIRASNRKVNTKTSQKTSQKKIAILFWVNQIRI